MRVVWSAEGQRSRNSGGENDVLHAMDHRGLTRHFLDVHQPLQPQQPRAAVLGQRFQQQRQRQRRNRTIALQREGFDAVGVLCACERIARRRLGQVGEARRDAGAGEQVAGATSRADAQRGTGVKRGKPVAQSIRRRGEVGLAQQQRVGQRSLAARFGMAIERRLAVQRIDDA